MKRIAASFRDPNGFIFESNGGLYRQVNKRYQSDYESLQTSGLYDSLVKQGLLIAHTEVDIKLAPEPPQAYKIIKPQLVPFVSYPYEWSFSQLKDAALATLKIQKTAMEHGLSLKDASAYNIQFYKGQPVLIDSLSFEKYKVGEPWVAYKQYCQHFLAPLALMAYTDARLAQLLRIYIDGIPLDLASQLLPSKTKFRPLLATHIHLHARTQTKYANKKTGLKKPTISQQALTGVLNSLISVTKSLAWNPKGTEWGEYYTFTNYSSSAFEQKRQLIEGYLKLVQPKRVWDLGANTGLFSRIASSQGIETVAFDIDPIAVEKNYRQMLTDKEQHMLPLIMDLTNPSPALGWSHAERESLLQRGPADLVLALALIHHLAISNNVPLVDNAAFFAKAGRHLVIEFVPKGDSQVDKLLATREDIFDNYHEAGFEAAFGKYFEILKKHKIRGSKRTLYLMKSK